ncbi:hypothetical protein KKF91_06075, partial [Myxococcota bacterium]|nr:hypothetical protein [Myxococcota bacterium]
MNALHLDWLADPPKLPADTPRLDLTFKLDLRVDGQAPHAPLVIAVGVVGEMIGAPSRVLVGLRDAIREALDDQDRLILLGEEAPSPFDFKGALSAGAEALRRINPEFNRRILLLVHGQELISPGSYEILTKQGIGLDVITVDPDVEQGAFVRFAALLGGEAMAVNPESALSLAEGRARALKAARYPGARLTLTPLGPTTLQRLYRLSPSPVFLGDIPEGPVSLDLGPLAPPPSWIITAELPRLHVGLYEALAAELTWLEK